LLPRSCRFCQQFFHPSKFRPDQSVCSQPDCQRRRRSEYHRRKLESDPEYAQVVRDSRQKWRQAHRDYQKNYWRTHSPQAERNRRQQRQRDRQRHLQNLVKNNLALDLKRTEAEVYLFGPAADDLVKNNLAHSKLLIFQPVAKATPAPSGS
jgi:hypothetical protein